MILYKYRECYTPTPIFRKLEMCFDGMVMVLRSQTQNSKFQLLCLDAKEEMIYVLVYTGKEGTSYSFFFFAIDYMR